MNNATKKYVQISFRSAKNRNRAIVRLAEDGYTDVEKYYTPNAAWCLRVYVYSGTADEATHVCNVASEI
jgi:hypothetical protein